jgi:hypothetical protein
MIVSAFKPQHFRSLYAKSSPPARGDEQPGGWWARSILGRPFTPDDPFAMEQTHVRLLFATSGSIGSDWDAPTSYSRCTANVVGRYGPKNPGPQSCLALAGHCFPALLVRGT